MGIIRWGSEVSRNNDQKGSAENGLEFSTKQLKISQVMRSQATCLADCVKWRVGKHCGFTLKLHNN